MKIGPAGNCRKETSDGYGDVMVVFPIPKTRIIMTIGHIVTKQNLPVVLYMYVISYSYEMLVAGIAAIIVDIPVSVAGSAP